MFVEKQFKRSRCEDLNFITQKAKNEEVRYTDMAIDQDVMCGVVGCDAMWRDVMCNMGNVICRSYPQSKDQTNKIKLNGIDENRQSKMLC